VTFPTVEDVVSEGFSSATTAHAVSMPATVSSGELLIAMVSFEGASDPNITTPSGWAQDFHVDSAGFAGVHTAYSKVADGTEGGTTVDFVSNINAYAAAMVYRISGWEGTLSGLEYSTSRYQETSSPDPNSLTPSWGSDDTLWIVCNGAVDDDVTVSTYPTNFTSNQISQVSGGGTNNGPAVHAATREEAASSQDPGTWGLSSSDGCVTWTIGIQPGADVGGAVLDERRMPRGVLRGVMRGAA